MTSIKSYFDIKFLATIILGKLT